MKTIFILILISICSFAKAQQEYTPPSDDIMTMKSGKQLHVNTLFSTNKDVYFRLGNDSIIFKLSIDSLKNYNKQYAMGDISVGGLLIKGSRTSQTGIAIMIAGSIIAFGAPIVWNNKYAQLPGAAISLIGLITWINGYSSYKRAGQLLVAKPYK